jgi:hypothetical protein
MSDIHNPSIIYITALIGTFNKELYILDFMANFRNSKSVL